MATKSSKAAADAGKQCFFITPIGDETSTERRRADWIFNLVIEPACAAHGLKPERADRMSASAMIGTNIFRAIAEAPVCVADLTALNPNVLYEMGVRHTLRKPIVHIAQIGTRLPFDTAAHLTHFYDLESHGSVTGLAAAVTDQLGPILGDSYEVSNPFTQALGAIELRESEDPKERLIADMHERLKVLERSASRPVLMPKAARVSTDDLRMTGVVIALLRSNLPREKLPLITPETVRSAARDAQEHEAEAMWSLIKQSNFADKDELLSAMSTYWPEVLD